MGGYLTKNYADSLSGFGTPRLLPASRGWILKQRIQDTEYFDGRGCYPLFMCERPQDLLADFETVKKEILTLSFVTDPFSSFSLENWQKIMPDVCFHYKDHVILELTKGYEKQIVNNHKRNIKKAQRLLTVKEAQTPVSLLERWNQLYGHLIERHQIKGMARFSKEAFAKQLSTPGIRAFFAEYDGSMVGMVLWYKIKNTVYYHLAAYNEDGYKTKASFAIFEYALKKFKEEGIENVSLGAGAGVRNNGKDGLTRFKTGWSKTTRPVYFCGKIFNKKIYNKLAGTQEDAYFPAYRAKKGNR